MFLRRLIKNLKSQDWTAVLIELVILVLGVFLGLRAQEWSNSRQADAKAEEYAQRLLADFRSEHWMRTMLYEYYDDVAMNNELVLDAVEGRAPLNDEQFLVAAFRATQYIQWYTRPSTYDELLSIGAVDMVRDDRLREQARLTYGSTLMDKIEGEAEAARFRVAFRSLVALPVQLQLGRNCGDRIPSAGEYASLPNLLNYRCDTGVDPEQVAEAVAALRAMDGVAPMLRYRVTQIATRQSALSRNLKEIGELLETADKP